MKPKNVEDYEEWDGKTEPADLCWL